nr:15221_t:CDS:2 [Entrophospora candida]
MATIEKIEQELNKTNNKLDVGSKGVEEDDYKKSRASGIGKTRFLNETVRWMKDNVDDANSPLKKIYPNNKTK